MGFRYLSWFVWKQDGLSCHLVSWFLIMFPAKTLFFWWYISFSGAPILAQGNDWNRKFFVTDLAGFRVFPRSLPSSSRSWAVPASLCLFQWGMQYLNRANTWKITKIWENDDSVNPTSWRIKWYLTLSISKTRGFWGPKPQIPSSEAAT